LKKDICDIELTFNGNSIKNVSTHKHLGITFSSDGKWSKHIDNIIKSTSKMITSMYKLKYLVNRCTLNTIYTMYIRPHFEYACEVWDGCTDEDSNKLERLQLQAARIVTGLPTYTSKIHLYFETGWETLKERRKKRKMSQFYKLFYGLAPTYLSDKLPANVHSKSKYNLRNADNIIIPYARTSLAYGSFIPSACRLWNELPIEIRHSDSVSIFKSNIRNDYPIAPAYYSHGSRKYCILLTKLRYSVSSLNYDMFKISISDTASCMCGNPCENAFHYLLECNRYCNFRRDMLMNIHSITMNYDLQIDVALLLSGSSNLSVKENENILGLVQVYIKLTKRFD
jgi:hypothetical protein